MNTVRICLACTAVLTCAANANLIVNGSFEDSNLNPGAQWIPMNGGNTAITGWTTIGSGIDYMGTILNASDGTRSIDINNLNAGGGIAQTFATNAGWIYTVEFDMSANMGGSPALKQMSVSADGQSELFVFDYIAAGSTPGAPMWERMTFVFIGDGSSATLSFSGVSTGVYGAELDNVVVTGVAPTPGTLAGFGVLGLMTTRRRRHGG